MKTAWRGVVAGAALWSLLALPSLALAQEDPTAAGVRAAYLQGHATLAFALQAIIGAFVAGRLGLRWRAEGQPGGAARGLGPGLVHIVVGCVAVALVWGVIPTGSLRAINVASLVSFLVGTCAGGAAAWGVTRRIEAGFAPRVDLDAEIARRLALLRAQEADEAQRPEAPQVHEAGRPGAPGEVTTPRHDVGQPEAPQAHEAGRPGTPGEPSPFVPATPADGDEKGQ